MDPRDRELYEDRSDRMPAGSDRPRLVGKLVGAYDPSNRKVYKFFITDIRFDEAENAPLTIDVGADPIYALDVSGGSDTGSAGTPQYAIIHPLQNDRWGFTRSSPPGSKLKLYVVGFGAGFDTSAGDGTRFHVTVWKTDGQTTGDVIFEGDCDDATDSQPIALYPFKDRHGFKLYYPGAGITDYVAGFVDPGIDETGWYSYKIEDKKGSYPFYMSIISLYFNETNTVGYSYDSDNNLCFAVVFWIYTIDFSMRDQLTFKDCLLAPIVGAEASIDVDGRAVPSAEIVTWKETQTTGDDGIAHLKWPAFAINSIPRPGPVSWNAPGYFPETGTEILNPFMFHYDRFAVLCKTDDTFLERDYNHQNDFTCLSKKYHVTLWNTGVCPDPPFADCATVDISWRIGDWVGRDIVLDLQETDPDTGQLILLYKSACRIARFRGPEGDYRNASMVMGSAGGFSLVSWIGTCEEATGFGGNRLTFSFDAPCNPDGTRPTSGKIMYANDQIAGQAFGYSCMHTTFVPNYVNVGIFDMQIGVWSE